MKVPTTPPVFQQLRVENTNLCGYKCTFCPREKLTRRKGVQSIDHFKLVLDRFSEYLNGASFSGPIHLHGYGEQLIDKNLPEKVKIANERYPKSIKHITTTLGHSVTDEYLEALLENGLRGMSVSFYGSDPEMYKHYTVSGDYEIAFKNLMKMIEIRDRIKSKIYISVKTSMVGLDSPIADPKLDFNKRLEDLGVHTHDFKINNYGDGRDYVEPTKLLCFNAIVRHILQVTWDLKIIPCCYDYNAELDYGSILDHSIKEVFESERMQTILKNHCEGKADIYNVCRNCSNRKMKDT